jgi:rhodanese-related sulfurtransferase
MSPMEVMRANETAPGSIMLLDVREGPSDALEVRIPNAASIPLGELAGRVEELTRDRRIAVCCWETWCNMGAKACLILLDSGRDAIEMLGGIAAWKSMGFPVEEAE